MWIKRIKLENFQKHDIFEANFTDKVNIILGETDAGKSCIVRGFNWIMFFSSLKSARKTGTKITTGEIEKNDGTIIRRIKSASINAYEIEKDGEIKRYDSFGRNMPEEVLNVLGCRLMDIDGEGLNLNIAPQISLPFLLKESGVFRMKVLNKLTGNDILDSVIQSFNKDNLKISRESKILEEDKGQKEESLFHQVEKLDKINCKYVMAKEVKEDLDIRISKFGKATKIFEELIMIKELRDSFADKYKRLKVPEKEAIESLKKSLADITKVSKLAEELKLNKNLLNEIRLKRETIKIPDNIEELKARHLKYVKIYNIYTELTCLSIELGDIKNKKSKTQYPEMKIINDIKKSIQIFNKVQEIIDNRTSIYNERVVLQNKIETITEQISGLNNKKIELYKASGVCPLCKSKVTDELLERITDAS